MKKDKYEESNLVTELSPVDLVEFTVTPAQAAEWLQFGRKGNEYRVTARTVDRYAESMIRGEWHYTGEPIIFGDDDFILDGHHRLEACTKAGVSFVTDVTFGRPHGAFAYIDSGKLRTTYHIAGMEGVPDPKISAIAYKWLYRFENGMLTQEGAHYRLPAWAIPEMYAKHPHLPDSAKLVPNGITTFITKGVAVFLHYYLSTVDAEATEVFFDRLSTGSDLRDRNPILVLRNGLINRRLAKRRDDRDNLNDMALVIKAWNHWRDGKRVKYVKWSAATEFFPEPH